MRSLFFILTALMVMGLAFWAYRENYETQEALAEAERLQREVSRARQRLRVLNAEWAYLNRPDRLRDLAELNFDKLGLMPLQPHQFGKVDQVAYPPRQSQAPLELSDPIDVSNQEEAAR